MIWRSTVVILTAFMMAYAALWVAPIILLAIGLGEFVFVGQVCFAILTLSILEAAVIRFPGVVPPDH